MAYICKFLLLLYLLVGNTRASHQKTREFVKSEMESLFANLTTLFEQRLMNVESKIETSFMNISETLQIYHKTATGGNLHPLEINNKSCIPFCIQMSTSQFLPQETAVEEISGDSGTIEFEGYANSHLSRKIWIMRPNMSTEILRVKFTMVENGLGSNAQLTVLSVGGTQQHMYTGLHSEWNTEREFNDVDLFVVILTMSYSKAEPPSFKLRFSVKRSDSYWMDWSHHESSHWSHEIEVFTENKIQYVTYPAQNRLFYPAERMFYAVIAPTSGNWFELNLKYLDLPGSAPQCDEVTFHVWFLQESPTEAKFELQPPSAMSRCGRPLNVSKAVGHSKVALVKFSPRSEPEEYGRGFMLEVKAPK